MEPEINGLEPIVLTPEETKTPTQSKKGHSWLGTVRTMALGWLVGNLFLGAILGVGVIILIASSGLVEVPFLSGKLFSPPSQKEVDQQALQSANKKLTDVNNLATGQVLPKIIISEAEINALLLDSFTKNTTEIINPSVKLSENKFVFNGNLAKTGAPVQVEGEIDASSGVLHLALLKTRFGNLNLPAQLANSVLNQSLAKIGFSLDNTALPARKIIFEEGQIILEDISKPSE